jgi:hypothetical protein
VLDYELAHGNEVTDVAFPEDRLCLVLRLPPRIAGTEAERALARSVQPFQFDDPHYGDANYSGYQSTESGDVIAVRRRKD